MADFAYFSGFTEDDSAPDLDTKPADSTHDLLPFAALSDRQFEFLGLLLTQKNPVHATDRCTLMGGSGDAGRDVIVHDESGRLQKIIQCKKYSERVTLPQVRAELTKLALHHHLDSSILGEGPVEYEVWAAVDFTRPAAKLIDGWPGSWNEEEARLGFGAVVSKYVAFKELRCWDALRLALTEEFPTLLNPRKRTQVELSLEVRDAPAVYAMFFEGSVRAAVADLKEILIESHAGTAHAEIDAALEVARRGNLSVALDRLQRQWDRSRAAMTQQEKFRLLKARSQVHLLSGNTRLAATDGRAAVRFADDPGESLLLEASVLLYEGLKPKAMEAAEAAIATDPGAARAWLVRLEADESDSPTSKLIERIPPLTLTDGEVAAAVARRALRECDFDLAVQHGRSAVGAMPDWVGAYVALCGALVAQTTRHGPPRAGEATGVLSEVVTLASRGLELPVPPSASEVRAALFLRRGQARELLGQEHEALDDLRNAHRLAPRAPSAVGHLSGLLARSGQREEAKRLLEAALEHDFIPKLALQLALLLRSGDEGDREAAIAVLSKARERHADYESLGSDILELLVTTHIQNGDSESALAVLREEWVANVPISLASALRARALHAHGSSEAAAMAASEALEQASELVGASDLRCVAQALALTQQHSGAIKLYQGYVGYTSCSFDVRSLLNSAMCADADDVVLDTCRKLRDEGVFDADAVDLETGVLLKYQAFPEAIEVLSEYMARWPGDKQMRAKRSYAALFVGRSDLVETDPHALPAAEDVNPRNAQLILEVLRRGGNSTSACEFAYAQVHLHPNDAAAHKNMVLAAGPVSDLSDVAMPDQVTAACAVGVQLDRSEAPRWFAFEDMLPRLVEEEISTDHPYARELLGKRVGDRVTFDADGLQPKEGAVVAIVPRFVWLARHCMDSWELRFPNDAFIWKLDVSPQKPEEQVDADPVLRAVDRRRESLVEIESIYQSAPIPLHILSRNMGCSTLEALSHVIQNSELQVRCCTGTGEELAAGMSAWGDCERIVLDPTAAATLLMFDFVDVVEALGVEVVLAASFVEELRGFLDSQNLDTLGALGKDAQGYYSESHDPAQRAAVLLALRASVERLVGACTIESGLPLARVPPEQRSQLVDTLGVSGAQSCAMAAAKNAALWSDDLPTGVVCAELLDVGRVWTQLVARSLAASGVLTVDRSEEISATLLAAGYDWTSINPLTILDGARRSGWDAEAPRLAIAIRRFADERATLDGLARLLVGSIQAVVAEAPDDETGRALSLRMCEQLASRSGGNEVLRFLFDRMVALELNDVVRACISKAIDEKVID